MWKTKSSNGASTSIGGLSWPTLAALVALPLPRLCSVERSDRFEPGAELARMRRGARRPAPLQLVGGGMQLPEELLRDRPELDAQGRIASDLAGDQRQLLARDAGVVEHP